VLHCSATPTWEKMRMRHAGPPKPGRTYQAGYIDNMSSPPSTTDHPSGSARRRGESESNTWHDLEVALAELAQSARSAVAPAEFYRKLLEECLRASAATGGVVWLRTADSFQPVAHLRWRSAELTRDDASRSAHESLLREASEHGDIRIVSPHAEHQENGSADRTDDTRLLGPVNIWSERDERATVAIIELALPSDSSPGTCRGCEQFLAVICDLAADYHAFRELRRLRADDDYRAQLLQLAGGVHRQLDVLVTAYAVANEGRRVMGCDRLNVVGAHGNRSRLLATSGVSRVERRSGVARRIEELAEMVRRSGDPVFYTDGQCDALPPVAELVELHADTSNVRQLAAIPVRRPMEPTDDDAARMSGRKNVQRQKHAEFVLVAEQFDARNGELRRDRLADIAGVCATALYNAEQVERLPLRWLLRPLGQLKRQVATHLSRATLIATAVASGIAALVVVPADFNIESTGTLEPAVRRDVFAPRDGLVDEVLVAHGAEVAAGQPLVRLRDPTLDLELKRVDGEMETVQRQIDAVQATRTNRQVRDAKPIDTYRLSAEERELQQRLKNLRQELELLNRERDALVVTSPIAGRVLSWDVGQRLVARPVERGEVLVSVADLSAEWQLELDVPDDRIGYVLAAQRKLRPDLAVQFRLSSDDREQHTGHIVETSRMADVDSRDTAASPTVRVNVSLDELNLSDAARRELRPGLSARAQIYCGRRSVGYVWLHDLWDALIEWWRF
jgi:multidrug efflux pump subunit AcrA (membrane-fusion protein)